MMLVPIPHPLGDRDPYKTPYRELQEVCRQLGLPTEGTHQQLAGMVMISQILSRPLS